MSRTPPEKLIPKADRLLIRSFPRIAQRLESELDSLDRAEMDAYLKLLPGAIERFQQFTTYKDDLHESVQGAILQLVTSFKPMNFGPGTAASVESDPQLETSNTSAEAEETVVGENGPEAPNGSDTSQPGNASSLPLSELAAPAGNDGEPDSPQAGPQNPRVRTRSRIQGMAASRRARRPTGESVDDRG